MTPRRELLTIYLDDHRAGAAGGSALARRVADRYGGEAGFEALIGIRHDIDADLRTLDDLRDRLGLHGGQLKRALAIAGERVGRLKPNGRLVRRSPLSRLLELELLGAGVAAKGRLWDALMVAGGSDRLDDIDFQHLRDRAADQLERIHGLHRLAAEAMEVPQRWTSARRRRSRARMC